MKFLEKFDKKSLFKSRIVLLAFGLLILVISIWALRAIFFNTQEIQTKTELPQEVRIKPTSEVISDERLWRQSLQERIGEETTKLNSAIDNLKQDISKTDSSSVSALDKIASLESRFAHLSDELLKLKSSQDVSVKAVENVQTRLKQINQYTLGLENSLASADYKPIKTSDNYIPCGSIAKAVLLSGVDASTSVKSQQDPEPILIRITDHGTLPRRFKSDLKDCHIIGSAYGHLSSKRAKIRLEKLSCVEISTGEIIETVIVGMVAGEDGISGVRGTVISTESQLVINSLLSGVLSGLSNNLSTQNQSFSLFASDNKQLSGPEKLKNNMATGASSALERVSKYYMDILESLHPVVEIVPGRKVEVIFTEGVFFGTSSIRKEIAKKRDEEIKNESKREFLY